MKTLKKTFENLKKIMIYLILIISLFVGCKAQNEILLEGKTYENFRGFEPVDPIEYDDNVQVIVDQTLVNKEMKLLTSDEMLQFLNNETVLVSIGQVNAEGGISYIPITVSAKHSSYKVTMDYMKFTTLGQKDEYENFIGFKRVGVGLRLISLITTTEAGINIGDLSSIGLAAKAGKVKGTLMVEVVGIKSKEVTTLLPLPSEINQTTIQNAMQALATIKSKIYDNETKLYPQVMAVKTVDLIEFHKTSKSTKAIDKSNIKRGELFESDEKLVNQENKIKLQTKNNKIEPTQNSELAEKLQYEAFDLLLKKEVDKALEKFIECEKAFSKYNSIYEIKGLLIKEKKFLTDPNSSKWEEVYSTILKEYSWRLPQEIKKRLSDKILVKEN